MHAQPVDPSVTVALARCLSAFPKLDAPAVDPAETVRTAEFLASAIKRSHAVVIGAKMIALVELQSLCKQVHCRASHCSV